jgi:integrase
MARKPSPWYWPERHGWYTILSGQRRRLLDLAPDAPAPRKRGGKWVAPPEVEELFRALLVADDERRRRPDNRAAGPTVAEVFDKYLDWCQKHRQPRTFDWYRDHVQDFLDWKPEIAHLPVSELKPFHVVEWADSHGQSWSNAYRRGGVIAIQRPFNWAAELGYIPASPIRRVPKPQPQRRENPVTADDFAGIIARYAEGDPFRDLLEFAWHSGCRPQETTRIEARHVQIEAHMIVIPKEEAKGRKRPRVIHLQGRALEIVRRLLAQRPRGRLFVNEDGTPWKRFSIANRFDRLHLALGIEALKEQGILVPPLPRFNRRAYRDRTQLAEARAAHQEKLRQRRKEILKLARQHSTKFAAYDIRHGFCQRKLEQGVSHLVVAELMGHSTGRMVAETYSHMNTATDHLKKALEEKPGG